MSGNIAPSDSYVTPTPDPRLATLPGSWSLASDLTANSTTIQLSRERVSCMVSFPARCFSGPCAPCPDGATTVRIEDELAVFTRLDPASGSLTGVKRGAFGTTPQAYTAGTRVKVMARGSGPTFLAAGTLVDEIGANIARAVDRVGADTVYFDGLGQLLPVVSGGATERFDCSRLQLSFWRHAKRQVIAQSDTEGENQLESGHLWHLDSRSGQTDFAATDSKAFLDKIKSVLERAHRELFSPDLGWWGYLPWTQSYAATTPDEVAYMASRAAGWSGSPALETEFDKLGLSASTANCLALCFCPPDLSPVVAQMGALTRHCRRWRHGAGSICPTRYARCCGNPPATTLSCTRTLRAPGLCGHATTSRALSTRLGRRRPSSPLPPRSNSPRWG